VRREPIVQERHITDRFVCRRAGPWTERIKAIREVSAKVEDLASKAPAASLSFAIIQVSFVVVWSQRVPTYSPRNNPIYDRSELYDTLAILGRGIVEGSQPAHREASRDPLRSKEKL